MNNNVDAHDLETEHEDSPALQCSLCQGGVIFENSVVFDVHKESLRHKYNYLLEVYSRNVLGKVKDRHGIQISITCPTHQVIYNEKRGKAKSILDVDSDGLVYSFAVLNTSDKPILLIEAVLLHPLHVFQLEWDPSAVATPIAKGEKRLITVKFKNEDISYFDVPVCFKFHRNGHESFIIKEMDIEVTRREFEKELEDELIERSPFQGEHWIKMDGIVYGTRPDGSNLKNFLEYPIPKEYHMLFRKALRTWDHMNDQQLILLNDILTSFPALVGFTDGFSATHQRFFHYMLHLDEFAAKATLHHYNMTNVPMHVVVAGRVELKVPGLAEKRPSVLKGDIVIARVRADAETWESIAYEGIVAEVRESVVWISGFEQSLMYRLQQAGVMQFDIRFMLNRYTYFVQHRAVDLVHNRDLLDVIFPGNTEPMPALLPENKDITFLNLQVAANHEQKEAVRSILKGCCRPAPYIVFGPPGTGKTVTLVETILQIKKLFFNSRVLVCAPSNAACDHLTQRLMGKCDTTEMLRLHSTSRAVEGVPKDVLKYSNTSGPKFDHFSQMDLLKYRIIVCTLTTAAKFASESVTTLNQAYHFTHVFVDEAGQAIEPQALVAIGGILGPVDARYPGGQLILAGDPKQLGPICSSPLAQRAGLGLSLLERLMEHCDLYKRQSDGSYDTRYISKLLDNFRAHPSLLELPNRLFYDGELRAACNADVLKDPISSTVLIPSKTHKTVGHTVVFQAVIGQERQEGKSPSYYNELEIDVVMRYISLLLSENQTFSVKQRDIGIITPYIRQVYKLKRRLESRGWNDVEVGSTEAFQGREKRVIIISTVRSNRNLLSHDKKFKLGFLVDPKRFNVAVTRARSLLIVVGCAHVLESDSNWSSLIELTKQRRSYYGCEYDMRGDKWTKDVIERIHAPAVSANN